MAYERLRRAVCAVGVIWLFAPALGCLVTAAVVGVQGGPSAVVVPLLLVGVLFAFAAAMRLWW